MQQNTGKTNSIIVLSFPKKIFPVMYIVLLVGFILPEQNNQ